MRTRRYDGSDVRKILIGMYADRTVCARIASQWPREGLFDSEPANLLGKLIVQHFRKYNKNPDGELFSIFDDWAKSSLVPEETVDSIEKLLHSLEDTPYRESAEYTIDLAGQLFNKIRLEAAIADAQADIQQWKIDEAEERLRGLKRINLGVGSFIEPGKDIEIWTRAFNGDRSRGMVSYREDLGNFFGDAFQRGRFFSFMASDKSGKTTWLVDFVYRALRARNRVAFFDVGDMLEEDFMRSLAARTLNQPEFECEVSIPKYWDADEEFPEFTKTHAKGLDVYDAYRAFVRMSGTAENLRAQFHPSSTLSVDDLDGILGEWDQNDWRPDVVIVDYADILAPPKGYHDVLEQIDVTWKRLRTVSQKRHCLLITATQASALNYGKEEWLLGKKDFSGRKTKLAHVSGIIGINVSSAEREKGMCRINKFAWRHGRHSEKDFVRVAGCYDISNPAIVSKRRERKAKKSDE